MFKRGSSLLRAHAKCPEIHLLELLRKARLNGPFQFVHRELQLAAFDGGAEHDGVQNLRGADLGADGGGVHNNDVVSGLPEIGNCVCSFIMTEAERCSDRNDGLLADDYRTIFFQIGQAALCLAGLKAQNEIGLAAGDHGRVDFVSDAHVADDGTAALGHADGLGGTCHEAAVHGGKGNQF